MTEICFFSYQQSQFYGIFACTVCRTCFREIDRCKNHLVYGKFILDSPAETLEREKDGTGDTGGVQTLDLAE
jgi:hypothetical protein